MKKAIWILWPGFIVAGVAEVLFFTVVDPVEIHLFGQPAGVSRLAAYTLGFLFFWVFAASSSAFTCFCSAAPRRSTGARFRQASGRRSVPVARMEMPSASASCAAAVRSDARGHTRTYSPA